MCAFWKSHSEGIVLIFVFKMNVQYNIIMYKGGIDRPVKKNDEKSWTLHGCGPRTYPPLKRLVRVIASRKGWVGTWPATKLDLKIELVGEISVGNSDAFSFSITMHFCITCSLFTQNRKHKPLVQCFDIKGLKTTDNNASLIQNTS